MKRCMRCGKVYDDAYSFCPSCGGDLVAVAVPPQADMAGYAYQSQHQPDMQGYAYQSQHQPDMQGYAYQSQPQPDMTGYVYPDQTQADMSGYYGQNDASGYYQNQMPPDYLAAPAAAAASIPKPKKKSKAPLIISICLLVLALLGGGGYYAYTKISAPRPLIINSNSDIETYVWEETEIPLSAEGLTPADFKSIVWTIDNNDSNIITIEDGVLYADYDSNSFDATTDTYTTTIHGTLKKGIKNWEGDAKVVVHLEPVDFTSGELIKSPAGSTESYIIITASKNYDSYLYFENTTNPDNDISFILKAGDVKTIYFPVGTYNLYEASGTTWYGEYIKFGPGTVYKKDADPFEFKSTTYWTLELDVTGGNLTSDDIDSEDFPG